jgi:DnaJ-class molecular chaperone
MEQRDYYGILGVERNAHQREIKAAYRNLALRYHPDRNSDPSAAAKMKEINEAYAVLSDPGKRGQYDALRQQFGSSAYSQFRQNYSEQDIFRGSDIHKVFEDLTRAFGLRGFDEIFREFYGPGYGGFEFRQPGIFGRGFAFGGFPGRDAKGMPGFRLGGPVGRVLKYVLKKHWGLELPERGKDLEDRIVVPPELAGRGGKIQYLCRMNSKELMVTIPPGMRDGQRMRLRGMGGEGKGGGEAGDLYVSLRVKRPLLQRAAGLLKGLSGHLR